MSRPASLAAILVFAAVATPSFAAEPDWSAVGKAMGKEGAVQPGGIYRVALPRTDLHVVLDGVTLKPGFALGGWLAFEAIGTQAMVMGDLVLTQDEINPVMKKLEEEGIEISALHNHLLRAEPATMYMHVMGHGDPVKLAQALHTALALSKIPFEAPSGTSQPPQMDLDTAAIDKIMGAQGKVNGGVLQYGIPRGDKVEESGMSVPPALGSAIGINFQPTGGGKVYVRNLVSGSSDAFAQALAERSCSSKCLAAFMARAPTRP